MMEGGELAGLVAAGFSGGSLSVSALIFLGFSCDANFCSFLLACLIPCLTCAAGVPRVVLYLDFRIMFPRACSLRYGYLAVSVLDGDIVPHIAGSFLDLSFVFSRLDSHFTCA